MIDALTYFGLVAPVSSYGVVSRLVVLELERRGITVFLPFHQDPDTRALLTKTAPEMLPIASRPIKQTEWGICHSLPQHLPYLTTKRRLLHTMLESSVMPPPLAAHANMADALVLPSSGIVPFYRASGVEVPIFVAVDPVDTDAFAFRERPERDTFSWLCFGDLSMRKQTIETIVTWRKAFSHQQDARLIMKSRKNWGLPRYSGTLQCSDSRISIIDANYSVEQLVSLCYQADAGLVLSRFEGFGDVVPQIAATGATSCLPAHTGALAYAHCGYFYPIGLNAERPTVSSLAPVFGDWCNPDLDEVVSTLRHMYEHRDIVRERGRLAASWVREHLTAKNHVDQLLGAIKALS